MEVLANNFNETTTTTTTQYPSTSTPLAAVSIGQQCQSTTWSQIQPFQPYDSNNFDTDSMGLFMKQDQDAASYSN